MESKSNPLSRSTVATMLLVFLAALAFRAFLFFSGIVDAVFETADSWEYILLAKGLLTGSFSKNGILSMDRTPGFPAMLAAVYYLFGTSQLAVTAAQAVIDAVTCALIIHMATLLRFGRIPLVLTAVFSVACPFTSAYTFQVMSETAYTFALTATAWMLIFAESGGLPRGGRTAFALGAGIAFGYGVLVRPVAAPAAAVFCILLLARDVKRLKAIGPVFRNLPIPAAFVFGISCLVLPWMLRNYLSFPEEFRKPKNDEVTLIGRKSPGPAFRFIYTPEFNTYLTSYEEPFVQMPASYSAPIVARYVYPGEEEEVRKVFADLESQIRTGGTHRDEILSRFAEIARKRRAAAPRLWLTAPFTKMLKVWISPRIAVLWGHGKSGANSGLFLVLVMTAYSCLYVVPGFLGIWWGLRERSFFIAAYLMSLIASITWAYAFFAPIVQSRYAVPIFPLLSLSFGALAQSLIDRKKSTA